MALDPITAALDMGGKLIDHFFPNAADKAAAQLKLLELAQSGDLAVIAGQTEINKAEATNTNMFIAGWRPFVGWICGVGLGVQFIFGPLGSWLAALFGHPIVVPSLDMGTLMTLLAGMLGLSGMRTMEKLQNSEGNR